MEKTNVDFEMVMVECDMKDGEKEMFCTSDFEEAKEILDDYYYDDLVTYKMWGLIKDGYNPRNIKSEKVVVAKISDIKEFGADKAMEMAIERIKKEKEMK